MNQLRGYTVTWTTAHAATEKDKTVETYTDHFIVFCDGKLADNKAAAKAKYAELLNDEDTYTAQICHIVESTEPHHLE